MPQVELKWVGRRKRQITGVTPDITPFRTVYAQSTQGIMVVQYETSFSRILLICLLKLLILYKL